MLEMTEAEFMETERMEAEKHDEKVKESVMKKWVVRVEETLCKMVEVEAEDSQEAIEKVRDAYRNADIVLDYEDYVDTDFDCETEQDGSYTCDMTLDEDEEE